MLTPVSKSDIDRVLDRHRTTFIDCQGYSVRVYYFRVFRYIGDQEMQIANGKCWAWCISDARKILGDELRNREDWRGCDGRIC